MQARQTPHSKPADHSTPQIALVSEAVESNIETSRRLQKESLDNIVKAAAMMTSALREGRKIVLFGNGGSAADAQHIAAELVGRFRADRPPLRALALTTNSSILTAIGNDLAFEEIFSRQVSSEVQEGDVVIGISTSGRSKNVLNAIREARRIRAKTIGLTGSAGGQLASLCDHSILVPSDDTQRIQESHIMIGHILCELIEFALTKTHES